MIAGYAKGKLVDAVEASRVALALGTDPAERGQGTPRVEPWVAN